MKANFVLCLIGFWLALLGQFALSKPVDIIYRGGDCPCGSVDSADNSGDGCGSSMLGGYGMSASSGGRYGSGDCSQPRFRINTENSQVKYIFDYNIEVPVQTSQVNVPLTDLYARVDKILVDARTAKIVNTDCTCRDKQAVEAGIVAPCPVHAIPTSYCGSQNNRLSRYAIRFIPPRLEILSKSNRAKRSIHKKHKHAKKSSSPKETGYGKNHDKHRIHKREAREGTVLQGPTNNFKKHAEIIQYFPEVLSASFKPGQCYTCSASERKDLRRQSLDLVCEPQQIAADTRTNPTQYVGQLADASLDYTAPMARSEKEDDDYNLAAQHGIVIQPEQSYPDYIKSVVYSHGDFTNAAGHPTELVDSEETQEENAQIYIQKLMQDELAKTVGARFLRSQYPSSLEILPASRREAENSFLIKLRQPHSKVTR